MVEIMIRVGEWLAMEVVQREGDGLVDIVGIWMDVEG
jgi:hypothetical protein